MWVSRTAVLTGAACRASKRSLIVWCAVSGQVPCSGAKRRGKVLDEVSTAVHGDAVAVNGEITCRPTRFPPFKNALISGQVY